MNDGMKGPGKDVMDVFQTRGAVTPLQPTSDRPVPPAQPPMPYQQPAQQPPQQMSPPQQTLYPHSGPPRAGEPAPAPVDPFSVAPPPPPAAPKPEIRPLYMQVDDRESNIFAVQMATATVKLPSHGLPYGGKIPDGILEVKPMTAREEKMLAGMKGGMSKILDSLFKRTIITPINPDELVVGDRMYLFFTLRANTYGSEYSFILKCPNCSLKFSHTIDLSTLEIMHLPEGWEEPFFAQLPVCGKRIGMKLLRGSEQKEIETLTDRDYKRQNRGEGDISYIYRLAKAVVSINDYEVTPNDFLKVVNMIESLHGNDSWELRKVVENNDCGLDLGIHLDCPKCDAMIEDLLPMTADFFRPRRTGPS